MDGVYVYLVDKEVTLNKSIEDDEKIVIKSNEVNVRKNIQTNVGSSLLGPILPQDSPIRDSNLQS